MTSKVLTYIVLLLFSGIPIVEDTVEQETKDDWHLLADVKIEKKWDDLLQEDRDFPLFGERLRAKAGQEIELAGYMVPLNELLGQNYFVISSLPFQTCFFVAERDRKRSPKLKPPKLSNTPIRRFGFGVH